MSKIKEIFRRFMGMKSNNLLFIGLYIFLIISYIVMRSIING